MQNAINSASRAIATAVAAALIAANPAAAQSGIQLQGDVTQVVESTGPVVQTAIAGGNKSTAETSVNTVEGQVTVKGNLTQSLKAKTLVQTAIAAGNQAEAKTRINVITTNP